MSLNSRRFKTSIGRQTSSAGLARNDGDEAAVNRNHHLFNSDHVDSMVQHSAGLRDSSHEKMIPKSARYNRVQTLLSDRSVLMDLNTTTSHPYGNNFPSRTTQQEQRVRKNTEGLAKAKAGIIPTFHLSSLVAAGRSFSDDDENIPDQTKWKKLNRVRATTAKYVLQRPAMSSLDCHGPISERSSKGSRRASAPNESQLGKNANSRISKRRPLLAKKAVDQRNNAAPSALEMAYATCKRPVPSRLHRQMASKVHLRPSRQNQYDSLWKVDTKHSGEILNSRRKGSVDRAYENIVGELAAVTLDKDTSTSCRLLFSQMKSPGKVASCVARDRIGSDEEQQQSEVERDLPPVQNSNAAPTTAGNVPIHSSKRLVLLSPFVGRKRRDTKNTPSSKKGLRIELPEAFVVNVNRRHGSTQLDDDTASSLSNESMSDRCAINFEPKGLSRDRQPVPPVMTSRSDAILDCELINEPYPDDVESNDMGIHAASLELNAQAPLETQQASKNLSVSSSTVEMHDVSPLVVDLFGVPSVVLDVIDEAISVSSDSAATSQVDNPTFRERSDSPLATNQRPKRNRKVTDRFTISAHAAGGRYLPGYHEHAKRNGDTKRSLRTCGATDGQVTQLYSVPFHEERQSSDGSYRGDEETVREVHVQSASHMKSSVHSDTREQIIQHDGREIRSANERPQRIRSKTDFYHNMAERNDHNGDCSSIGSLESGDDVSVLSEDNDCSRKQVSLNKTEPQRLRTDWHDVDQAQAIDKSQRGFRPAGNPSAEQPDDGCASDVRSLEPDDNVSEVDDCSDNQAFLVKAEPRRLRQVIRRPVLAKFGASGPTAAGWTSEQLSQLGESHRHVDPTSSTFWFDVASLVYGKTAEECRLQWFSSALTPALKPHKRIALCLETSRDYDGDNDDDIFDSTPMRGGLFPSMHAISKSTIALPFALDKAPDMPTERSSAGRLDRPKPLYKSYLQRMKRDVARMDNAARSRKGPSKPNSKTAKNISEDVFDNDVDIKVRLTPGGTLKVSSHADEEIDYWSDMSEMDEDVDYR